MSTPTIFIPPPDADEVARRLESEMQRQQEATPEPVFQTDTAEQSYKWLCEIEHKKFAPQEIDDIRMRISNTDYWQREAQHLKGILFERIWKDLCHQYASDDLCTANDWQNINLAIRRRLKRYGFNSEQIQRSRLSIEDQSYWKPEADCLRQMSTLQEREMQEQFWAKEASTKCISSSPEGQTQRPSQRRQRRQNRSRQKSGVGRQRRSERLQSRLALEVETHRGQVGAKKRKI